MASRRLTDRVIREIPTPEAPRQEIVRDDLVIGFAVRKTATGCTAFVLHYVAAGRERRTTIGKYPAWSVAAAREEAKRLRRKVDAGEDPLEEKRVAREELTLGQLWERYSMEILIRKAPSTQRNESSVWSRIILPELGRRKLSQIGPSDVDHLHNRVSARTPVQANRCLASLRHVFATAIRWRITSDNPVVGAARNREQGRERYLSDEEKRRLFSALEARGDTPSTLAIRFLLLTGARSGEVFGATWDQFDLTSGVWIKPSAHTKQRRLHRVPLSDAALDVLRRARGHGTGNVVLSSLQERCRMVSQAASHVGFPQNMPI